METAGVPLFSGGATAEEQGGSEAEYVRHGVVVSGAQWQAQPANADSVGVNPSDHPSMRPTSTKERVALLAADARLGAQVMRVRAGLDAKMQMVRDQQPISSFLSRLGFGNGGVPPALVDAEGDPDLSDPPGLRPLIDLFHETRSHLDVILPALEDYQRHRRGLADAEQRIGIALQEAGMRGFGTDQGCLPNSPSAQALSACGLAHRSAAVRRLEAAQTEEQQVLDALRMHDKQAVGDCRRAVREYEAARQELKTVRDARAQNSTAKQGFGADFGDPVVSPTIGAAAEETEHKVRQRLANATESVGAKLSMLQVKHAVDYATAVTSHIKCVGAEERDVAEHLSKLDKEVRTILEAASHASLKC